MFDEPQMVSFFNMFSILNAKTFKFEEINRFMNNRGVLDEDEVPPAEEILSPKKGKKGKKKALKKNEEK